MSVFDVDLGVGKKYYGLLIIQHIMYVRVFGNNTG